MEITWAGAQQNPQNGICPAETLVSLHGYAVWSVFCWALLRVAKDQKILLVDREDSDVTAGMCRLIGVFVACTYHFLGFAVHWWRSWHNPGTQPAKWACARQNQQNDLHPSEESDQPGHLRMPRLIWVFAGHTGNSVAFVMLHLSFTENSRSCYTFGLTNYRVGQPTVTNSMPGWGIMWVPRGWYQYFIEEMLWNCLKAKNMWLILRTCPRHNHIIWARLWQSLSMSFTINIYRCRSTCSWALFTS